MRRLKVYYQGDTFQTKVKEAASYGSLEELASDFMKELQNLEGISFELLDGSYVVLGSGAIQGCVFHFEDAADATD